MQIEADYSQVYLLPPSIEDWVPIDHPARFIREFVDAINLEDYGFNKPLNNEGRPSYSNNLLIKIWLYNYYEKIYSTRQIEKACRNHLPLIWLTAMNYPDHNTIWRFFKENKKQIKEIFKQTVKLAVKNDMVGFVLQAVDGTKIKANVSKGKTLYGADLTELLNIVDKSIDRANSEIEKQKETEKDYPSSKLPKKLQGKRQLQNLIKHGVEELRAEEKQALKNHCEEGLDILKSKNRKKLSLTDLDSRLIKTWGGKDFHYNVQGLVDSKAQIIVGSIATNEETDNHLLTKMIEEGKANSGKIAKVTLGDTGYFSGEEIKKAEESNYPILVNIPKGLSRKEKGYRKEDFKYDENKDCYICSENKELNFSSQNQRKDKNHYTRVYICRNHQTCPEKSKCSPTKTGRRIERYEFEDSLNRQREKQKTEENKLLLGKRSQIVEAVFAWIKHNGNFNRWLYRGLESVEAQWLLLCSSVNLRKLYSQWSKKRLVFN